MIKLLQGIYVVSEHGETMAAIDLGEFKLDDVLFGGFLSAIQMYCQRMSGTAVSEISLGPHRMMISEADTTYLATIHDDGDKKAKDDHERVLNVLKDGVPDIITDDLVNELREAGQTVRSGTESARDWASKML